MAQHAFLGGKETSDYNAIFLHDIEADIFKIRPFGESVMLFLYRRFSFTCNAVFNDLLLENCISNLL